MQEAAQLLSGEDVPVNILEALLGKVKCGQCVVINCTPYDAWLENVCLRWHQTHPKMKIHHCSVSMQHVLVDYVQKKMALQLMKALGYSYFQCPHILVTPSCRGLLFTNSHRRKHFPQRRLRCLMLRFWIFTCQNHGEISIQDISRNYPALCRIGKPTATAWARCEPISPIPRRSTTRLIQAPMASNSLRLKSTTANRGGTASLFHCPKRCDLCMQMMLCMGPNGENL